MFTETTTDKSEILQKHVNFTETKAHEAYHACDRQTSYSGASDGLNQRPVCHQLYVTLLYKF